MNLGKRWIAGVVAVSCTSLMMQHLPVKAATGSNCMMVVTYAELAYLKFKEAVKANEIGIAQKSIDKGMDQAKQAAAYAPQCDCPIAETYVLEAYAFGKRAKKATVLKDIRKEAKKAMDLSLDGMAAAQKCNSQK